MREARKGMERKKMETKETEITETIEKILKEHPEGLTISSIAEMIGMNRHSVVKYIYQLMGAEKLRMRKVGSAKLCYFEDSRNKSGK